MSLAVEDEDGNLAEFALACERALAQKPEQAMENIRRQLSKSGGTELECVDVNIDLSEA